jgi:putative ABC transport system permease protein
MFRWINQTLTVTALGVRTIPQRLGPSIVAVVGIAGVVVVFVSVLSIGVGFRAALVGAGSPGQAIVMRNGSESEMTSGLTGPETDIIKQAPGIARESGKLMAASEMYVVIDLDKRSTGTPANVPIRGIEPVSFDLRPDLHVVQGRSLQFGTNEAVVGRAAVREFSGIDLGAEYVSKQLSLKIVGIFESKGSVAESEIWCDARTLQGAYRRGNSYQSVVAKLDSPAAFQPFKDWLTTNPQLNVTTRLESDYYAEQTTVMTGLINGVGYVIAVLMGVAAVFGAILTMYTAVATRTREIATLRALGFNAWSVVASVLGESLSLAAVGGIFGGLLAYVAFNGYETATMNFQTFSQVAFAFTVTPSLLIQGLIYALVMGLVGGFFPAIRAARLPISVALREL